MTINWFPGHMHKATKEIKERLPQVDMIIEVLDARIPYSSSNPVITKLRGQKPTIKLLNKTDLADPVKTQAWIEYFEQDTTVTALPVSQENPERIKRLIADIAKRFPGKTERSETVNVMITGIPNVGKSTIINTVAGRIFAKTGNEPAVTKAQQRINLRNGIMLWDTPGILWGKFENQKSAYRLASTGAIKETAITNDDIACWLADYLLKAEPELLIKRYGIDPLPEFEVELLEQIGRDRGTLGRGHNVDFEKVSKVFLTEYRNCTIGRITLETPEMADAEEIETAELMAKRAAEKEAMPVKKKKKRKR